MQKNSTLKLTYDIQIKQLEEQIMREEQKIAQLEDQYIQKTKFCGNILAGFQYYFVQKTLSVPHNQDQTIDLDKKLFSLSSITSEISKQYSQLKTIPFKKTGRITRSKNKNNVKNKSKQSILRETQNIQQKKIKYVELYEQLSVQSQYNREGSLYKKPIHFEDQHKCKSEYNLSGTLTENSLSNSQTLPIAVLTEKSKKMSKKPQLNTNIKRWFNKQKRKSQNLFGDEQQDYFSEFNEKQGIFTLKQLKKRLQTRQKLRKANYLKQEQQNSDSGDSVDRFIKMARKIKKN